MGRIKDLIILNGRNIYPQDIESTIEQSHPELLPNSCAAFSITSDHREELIVVQEIPRSLAKAVPEIVSSIRDVISKSYQVRAHEVVPVSLRSLPRTTSGKIQRSVCRVSWYADDFKIVAKAEKPPLADFNRV